MAAMASGRVGAASMGAFQKLNELKSPSEAVPVMDGTGGPDAKVNESGKRPDVKLLLGTALIVHWI